MNWYVAFIAALVGGLTSGALSFFVRRHLDSAAKSDAERRLAHVYFVRVSEVVAIDIVARVMFRMRFAKDAAEKLSGPDGSYGPSHAMSVVVSEALRSLTKEQLGELDLRQLAHVARAMLEAPKDLSFSAEQLSRLPRDTVVAVHRYQGFLLHLRLILESWIRFAESDERDWATPEGIHQQWRALVLVSESARSVRLLLVKYGAVSAIEADELLKRQVEEYYDIGSAKYREQKKLDAARAAVIDATREASLGTGSKA